jgi:16S rRNA (guanine966-N2)-methyltransferase
VPEASDTRDARVSNTKAGAGSAPRVRRAAHARELRIIGGRWRGRKLRFPPSDAIRPTPDRVRETLFNWLAAVIPDAACLDLFAGSGALGLEALSRGAGHVTFVEHDEAAVRELRARLAEWAASGAQVQRADALGYLRSAAPQPFGVVFLDPPFEAGLLAPAASLLAARGWLAPGALIYVESPARDELPALPPDWQPLKAKRAGEVGYHLFRHPAGNTA